MRNKLFFALIVMAMVVTGCRTTEEESETASVRPGVKQPIGNVIDPTGVCSTDINEFGFASACDCPTDYKYYPVIGRCTITTRMCTQAIVSMFNPATGKCVHANNGCVAGDLGSAGWRTKDAGDQCSVTPPAVAASKKVAGFNFSGFKILDSLPGNFACPQIATAESDACINAAGNTTYAVNCAILCSQPIAKKGQVAGYDFKGPRIASGLPANGACLQNANAETDACLKINGDTTYDKNCKTLCSKPIAKKDKVAGFSFAGFKIEGKLPANIFCPQVVLEESDACHKANGNTEYTKGCGVLCSLPIAK